MFTLVLNSSRWLKVTVAVMVVLLAPAVSSHDSFYPPMDRTIYSSSSGMSNTHHRRLLSLTQYPMQTYYIPLPEEVLLNKALKVIASNSSTPPTLQTMDSIIVISISSNDTVVWYDHWEDGFDDNSLSQASATTHVWGDGNADNGCPPKVVPCTDFTDRIKAGSSYVIQANVPLPRNASTLLPDAGDRVQASLPIVVTRGAIPRPLGSVLAGAVDVVDTAHWGSQYTVPVGPKTNRNLTGTVSVSIDPFEFSAVFFMAGEDGTVVRLNGTDFALSQGQSGFALADMGVTLMSNKNVQVHLITGDKGSMYEMRWFSLTPDKDWDTTYVSPIGDTFARSRVAVYNPHMFPVSMAWTILSGGNGAETTLSKWVAPKTTAYSDFIPTGSGAKVVTSRVATVLSVTDTESRTYFNDTTAYINTAGQFSDWGCSLLPVNVLTSQILVGWGYGCTNNDCMGEADRNVVWITPINDCDIYIDYNNTGTDYEVIRQVRRWSSIRLRDPYDQDMSGAIIFAIVPNSTIHEGKSVNIAAAWGQDPSVSRANQPLSMDLGTVIRPYPKIYSANFVDKAFAAVGNTLVYTIKVVNTGQSQINPNLVTIVDGLDPQVTYVPNSAVHVFDPGSGVLMSLPIPDGIFPSTPFPLDESGHVIPLPLTKRGGVIEVRFRVTVSNSTSVTIVNNGTMYHPLGDPILFSATSTFVAFASSSDVIINEIMRSPKKLTDNASEWFELYNNDVNTINLTGWTFTSKTPLGGIETFTVTTPLYIAPGTYLVMGHNNIFALNGNYTVDYTYGREPNGSYNGFGLDDVDYIVMYNAAGTEIDRVEWDNSPIFPNAQGASMSLRTVDLNNTVGSNWCNSTTMWSLGGEGTPGSVNQCLAPSISPPTHAPTLTPTKRPTVTPSVSPTLQPIMPKSTTSPTKVPTVASTTKPTLTPTQAPTTAPTTQPTLSPTLRPSGAPSMAPAKSPVYGKDVYINEIMHNPMDVLDSLGEWFELYNNGTLTINLTGWTFHSESLLYGEESFTIDSPLSIQPNEYVVLGHNANFATNGMYYPNFTYSREADARVPYNGFVLDDVDSIAIRNAAGDEIDHVVWDNGPNFPNGEGTSMSLKKEVLDNTLGTSWCNSTSRWAADSSDMGTPGMRNQCSNVPTPSLTRTPVTPSPTHKPSSVPTKRRSVAPTNNPTTATVFPLQTTAMPVRSPVATIKATSIPSRQPVTVTAKPVLPTVTSKCRVKCGKGLGGFAVHRIDKSTGLCVERCRRLIRKRGGFKCGKCPV